MAIAIEQATLFDCYGFRSTSRADSRIQSWIQKLQKQGKVHHLLQQTANRQKIRRECQTSDLANYDMAFYNRNQSSWCRSNCLHMDEYGNKILVAVALLLSAAGTILDLIKYDCSSTSSCSTIRYLCLLVIDAWIVMCTCRGGPKVCHNKETRSLALAEEQVLTR